MVTKNHKRQVLPIRLEPQNLPVKISLNDHCRESAPCLFLWRRQTMIAAAVATASIINGSCVPAIPVYNPASGGCI